MFKIVHCKTSDEDVIQILDSQEETSLSADLSAVHEDDDEDTIEEAEYVHPETDDYMEEEEEEENHQAVIDNTQHRIQVDQVTHQNCTTSCCHHRGVQKLKYGLHRCVRSRPCSICVYLCLTLLVLASLVSLVVISVLIVVPYTRAASYQPSRCSPLRVTVDTEDRRCSCGKGCSSLYPCLQIRVSIQAVNYTLTDIQSSILYENEAIFMRKCSYYPPCKSSRIANDKSVGTYRARFGVVGRPFPCLFNPVNPRQVIRTRRFQLKHVLHGTLWSCLVCVVSSTGLGIIIKRRGCIYI